MVLVLLTRSDIYQMLQVDHHNIPTFLLVIYHDTNELVNLKKEAGSKDPK